MKYLFMIGFVMVSMGLYADSYSDDYESIRDNASDTHQEFELGERDYPNAMTSYRECREAYRYAVQIPELYSVD